MVRTHCTAALNKSNDRFFSNSTTTFMPALARVLILFKAADIGVVHFHGSAIAAKRGSNKRAHSFTQTMLHKPRGFVSYLQRAVELMRADALLAAGHQMRGLEPLVQRDMTALEYGPDRHSELTLAWAAAPQSGPPALYRGNPVKPATARAKRPLWPDNRLHAGDRSGLVMKVRGGKDGHGSTP